MLQYRRLVTGVLQYRRLQLVCYSSGACYSCFPLSEEPIGQAPSYSLHVLYFIQHKLANMAYLHNCVVFALESTGLYTVCVCVALQDCQTAFLSACDLWGAMTELVSFLLIFHSSD